MIDRRRHFEKRCDWDPDTGCWLWIPKPNAKTGYGEYYWEGRYEGAHRAAWKIYRGEIPNGLSVLHKCDVRHCVNPEHLFLGTELDNARDMAAKGRDAGAKGTHGAWRYPERWARGERQGSAKLTEDAVLEARRLREKGYTFNEISKRFGVYRTTIARAVKGTYWKHI